MNSILISPYGGKLVNLTISDEVKEDYKAYATRLPSLRIPERSVCDLELLATGAFSPLDRFMGMEDYQRVLDEMRLASGHIFPIPITLSVEAGPAIRLDQDVVLRNARNEVLALMTIEEIYDWNPDEVAQKVCVTKDMQHPLVAEMQAWGRLNISGRLKVLQVPRHFNFQALRLTPERVREKLQRFGYDNVVAFHTCNPLQGLHEEMTRRVVQKVDGAMLLHPTVGMTKPGDVDHYTCICTYKALCKKYSHPERILLGLLPLAARMAGPREALWHALIRRNYGANYLIVGRDHASPGLNARGEPFYSPYEAQELVESFQDELKVGVLPFGELVYLPAENGYQAVDKDSNGTSTVSISGPQVLKGSFKNGKTLPWWSTQTETIERVTEMYPWKHRQGVCIWFTGLSGAGKSTIAEMLTELLLEYGRQVTLLDGDVVRCHLSRCLGFSKEDRDTNVRRIGFVAAEIVRHGGVAVCAAVSPYRTARSDVRNMIGKGHFIEVFVDTPLEVCESRDVKGLYARARRGEIKGFTGIDDPYEPPQRAEITLDAVGHDPEQNARKILDYLRGKNLVQTASDNRGNGTYEMSYSLVVDDRQN